MMTRSIDRLIRSIGLLAAIVLLALVSTILYDALMRYFFSQGSMFLQELEWHLFDIVMLFSIAFTLQYNRHVRVDIFYHDFSKRLKAWIDLLGYLFMIIPFSSLVIYVSYDFVLMSLAQNEASANPGGIPFRYLIKSSMFLGFAFLLLQALSETLKFFDPKKSEA